MAGKHAKAVECADHRPVQHRDGRRPWCRQCGRDAVGEVPPSTLPGQGPPRPRPPRAAK